MASMLRAGIIGAGRIGWRYDGGRWDGRRSVSHAACLARHPRTQLVAMLDPASAALDDAAHALGEAVCVTDDMDRFFAQKLDLVCVASPTEAHDAHLRACVAAGVDYVLVEKPVTTDLADFQALLSDWERLASPPRVCVNYFRRALPQVRAMRAACRAGGLKALDLVYSRGLSVNGVHMLDLLGFLLDAEVPPPLAWVEGDPDNPSFGLHFDGPGVRVTVCGLDLPYHCIEARAFFEQGRMSLLDGGVRLEFEACEDNPDYPGFYHLGLPRAVIDPAHAAEAARDGTYRSLCDLVDDDMTIGSTLRSASFAQQLLEAVRVACCGG